jgi:alpha-1,2-mannosyltransferase
MPARPSPRGRPGVASVGGVAAVTAAVAAFLTWYGNRHDFFDLRIYLAATRWWADGHPLYEYVQPDRVQGQLYFTYPPFTALLLRPFADLPIGVTIGVLTAGTVLATVVSTWWLVGPVADRHGWPRWFVAGLAVPLVFATEPSRETITLGQVNMLLVVLILADLLHGVPKNSRLAGAGIGLATALKLYPGVFILYLLLARRWRAALVACGVAAGATLLAAAIAPRDSWQFWAGALWDTDRVGRTDYTGNQSLLGLISRLVAPEDPSRLVWLPVAVAVAGFGLWRAARAAAAGDELTGLALAGLAGALLSPISWPHHVYWFVPALVALVDRAAGAGAGAAGAVGGAAGAVGGGAGAVEGGRRERLTLVVLGIGVYAGAVFGVVSFTDFGTAKLPTDTPGEFVIRNLFVLLALLLVATLPAAGSSVSQVTSPPGITGDPSGGYAGRRCAQCPRASPK